MESSVHHGVSHTSTFWKILNWSYSTNQIIKMHNISSMYLLDTKYTAYQGIKFIIITFHAFILYRTPPRTRYGAAGGVYPGSTLLYVSLGFAGERFFDTFVLDTSSNQWSTSKSYITTLIIYYMSCLICLVVSKYVS